MNRGELIMPIERTGNQERVHRSSSQGEVGEVVREIARQLAAQGVDLRGKRLVKLDDNSLRVHTPSRGSFEGTARSVDISYDAGSDLYDVSVHTIKGVDVKTERHKGMYFDALPQFFKNKGE